MIFDLEKIIEEGFGCLSIANVRSVKIAQLFLFCMQFYSCHLMVAVELDGHYPCLTSIAHQFYS